MNAIRRTVRALISVGVRLWTMAWLMSLQHRPLLVALPLCSSVCFFSVRFVLSTLGISV
ncbi:hypothetical protein SAMN05443245_5434 [Paraburkholderia fungorum]|uniref:Uncharacterized protein n=1 Tax=Paraburkholderia fungorum TaxID=134537 RepID=A0A1H1INP4_9BURK|nr:hypothetical protein [Paraburkholderia fungorum]SDR39314.1 hypothetical protein SAMN05443245_5434 [Paraburkholderia fungorum]